LPPLFDRRVAVAVLNSTLNKPPPGASKASRSAAVLSVAGALVTVFELLAAIVEAPDAKL
jgi:hypothetical protein